jgi:DNA polymerase-4
MEMCRYIRERLSSFEAEHRCLPLLNEGVKQMGIAISDFVTEAGVLYSLFDAVRVKEDKLRKVVYGIKDQWGKYAVRKASEMVEKSGMQDAIGFGSVKDLYDGSGSKMNQFLLEETDE